jgi:hypothetical protein
MSSMDIATVNLQATLVAGSMESTITPRMVLVTLPVWLATTKPSVTSMLAREVGHQDEVVAPQWALVMLSIGMATAKPTTMSMM